LPSFTGNVSGCHQEVIGDLSQDSNAFSMAGERIYRNSHNKNPARELSVWGEPSRDADQVT